MALPAWTRSSPATRPFPPAGRSNCGRSTVAAIFRGSPPSFRRESLIGFSPIPNRECKLTESWRARVKGKQLGHTGTVIQHILTGASERVPSIVGRTSGLPVPGASGSPDSCSTLENAVEPQQSAKGSKYQLFTAPGAIHQRVRPMEAGSSSFCGSCAFLRPSNRRC